MTKLVKVYDFKTKTITEIPESELAPGLIQMTIPPHGDVWGNAEEAYKQSRSKIRHETLPPDLRKRTKALAKTFRDVDPRTPDKWEDSFKRDQHPDKEIEIFEKLIPLYVRFSRNAYPHKKKQEIYNLLILCTTTPLDSIPGVVQYEHLGAAEIAQIIETYRTGQPGSLPSGSKGTPSAEYVDIRGSKFPAYDIRNWHSLDDAKARLEHADIIWGVQRNDSNNVEIFYGKQFMRTIAEGLVGVQKITAVAIKIDFESEEPARLAAVIQVIKGFHDYGE